MPVSMSSNEAAQLTQTIEMFEVITQSQPLDYQSLEILKEAYSKLGRPEEAVRTSKRIAEAYLSLGQLSSAILEYEGILQRFPDDPDVQRALEEIESKASNLAAPAPNGDLEDSPQGRHMPAPSAQARKRVRAGPVDDGRQALQRIFVDGKVLAQRDFEQHWPEVDPDDAPRNALEPFIHILAQQQLVPVETSLRLLMDKSRVCFLPLERYEVDVELARGFPRDVCQRWCVLPFDRMSKSLLVATANPFNKAVVQDLEEFIPCRLLWYLASPSELLKLLRKVFR
jgi:hypothetical protein